MKTRVARSYELLKNCAEFRVKSDKTGTDFAVKRGNRHVNARTGFPAKPGEFANFPNSMVNFAPLEDSATGTLVIKPGDCLIQYKRFVKEPIRCILSGGRITEIVGAGEDAVFLRSWLASFNDQGCYVVSHIGWGCEHRAEIDPSTYRPMELESFAGNVLLAFGSNNASSLGGANKAAAHLDICLLGNDVFVDNTQILEKGRFVQPDLVSIEKLDGTQM